MDNTKYKGQDRGTSTDYQSYLSAMDAISVEKVASASAFFDPTPGNVLVDVGMASGTSSNILALLFPKLQVTGVDINDKMVEIANQTYQLPNLSFQLDDGEKLATFTEPNIAGFFNCSSIHHITSYNGYDPNRAYNTLKRQAELLKPGGIIVVRDFVKPPKQEVILDISNHATEYQPGDADLLIAFSQTARSLSPAHEIGFPILEISSPIKGLRRFKLFYSDAVEFIRRKDYFDNWDIELQEEYGYFTQKEFEDTLSGLGLRIIVSNPIYNQWIIKNRYKGKFTLYDQQMNDIGFPPTNYLIAAEKVLNKGTSIHLVRHLPESKKPFLEYASYIDSTNGKIFDVVKRPQQVADFVPYFISDGRLQVLAKHGYPRPLANIETDSPIIDQKHFGGYITEGISASLNHPLEKLLTERTGLKPESIGHRSQALTYYTSPGGIEEQVESWLVELTEAPSVESATVNTSGFASSGAIRCFDAEQLLKTAQTGALMEARLELNLYNLLRKLGKPFPKWMGEKIVIDKGELVPADLSNLLKQHLATYQVSHHNANYLLKHRAKFSEAGINDSSQILEYVTPNTVSNNTLVTLPIMEYQGNIYVGLEPRNLPVPQIISGNGFIVTAPACRLPKTINTYKQLENHMLEMPFFGTRITRFSKLGEKFYPSIGVIPEQVYPYTVTVETATPELNWVKLDELYKSAEMIRDGHLLVVLMRLVNAI
jgi:SAM-dependent methyltransferase